MSLYCAISRRLAASDNRLGALEGVGTFQLNSSRLGIELAAQRWASTRLVLGACDEFGLIYATGLGLSCGWMLLTFPDGRESPINYLREADQVFVGADGWWWRSFRDGNVPVKVRIKGEEFTGRARTVMDGLRSGQAQAVSALSACRAHRTGAMVCL